MAALDDDEHLSFAILAICDALEQRDDTKARESLTRARRHAHAILARYGKRTDETTPADAPEGESE